MLRSGAAWKTYLIVTLLITITTFIFALCYITERQNSLLKEKQLYLLGIAVTIERQFDIHEFNAEVEKIDQLAIGPQEKALILNAWLQPLLMEISSKYPEYGMGIYSKKIDRILAIGPNYRPDLLFQVTNPIYLGSYATRDYSFNEIGNSVAFNGKPILSVTYPITLNGKIIGHTWSSLKVENLDVEIRSLVIKLILCALFFWAFSLVALHLVFSNLHTALGTMAKQIKNQDDDRENFHDFPELLSIFDTIIELRESLKQEYLEKQEINQELSISKQATTELLDGLEDAFYSLDKDHKITYINTAALTLADKERDYAVGELVCNIFTTTCTPEFSQHLEHAYTIQQPLSRQIYVESMDKWYENRFYPYSNGGMVVCCRDITESKKIEWDLTRLDRLSIVGKMAAGISHEIRNPLTTVRGYLQWFSRKELFSHYTSQFELMIEELDRASHIISEFLGVAKEKRITIEEHNLKKIVESILPLLASDALLNGKSIITDLQNIPNLLLDQMEMRQLIINLVRNALEASDIGQSITIRTRVDNTQVYLEVSDQGKGIPTEILPQLGTPFVTTKDHGTGLGLATCYAIINRHQGNIDVKLKARGTTFRVSFPLEIPS